MSEEIKNFVIVLIAAFAAGLLLDQVRKFMPSA